MAALQYLESLRNAHPELSDWYNSLADLYQKKLWHQLTLKLEQFVALAVFQVCFSGLQVFHLWLFLVPMDAPVKCVCCWFFNQNKKCVRCLFIRIRVCEFPTVARNLFAPFFPWRDWEVMVL